VPSQHYREFLLSFTKVIVIAIVRLPPWTVNIRDTRRTTPQSVGRSVGPALIRPAGGKNAPYTWGVYHCQLTCFCISNTEIWKILSFGVNWSFFESTEGGVFRRKSP